MNKELQNKLIKLFGIDNLEKVCRLKELNNKLRKRGVGLDDDEYEEHEKLLEELEDVFPKF